MKARARLGRICFVGFVWVVLMFLSLPMIVVGFASFTRTGDVRFPAHFSFRWYESFFTSGTWLQSLMTSAAIAVVSSVFSTILALLAARYLVRARKNIRAAFDIVALLPLIVPHAALALAIFGATNTLGLRGTIWGFFFAHAILTLPFTYRPIMTNMSRIDLSMEEAGMSLGARPAYIFWSITLPLLRPALVSALLFAFIISFDEVTVAIFLAGPNINPLPVHILGEIEQRGSGVVAAISTLLVLVTVSAVLLLDRLIGLELFMQNRRKTA
jgi:putative spermidine/putrescine transport system permease protein